MASSKTVICNLALGHLGQGVTIANIVTEETPEAKICRRFYDLCAEKVQADFAWSFNTSIQALQLIEADPTDDWAFSYQFPVSCLEFLKIQSGQRVETRQSRVPYRVAIMDERKVILTDKANAIGEFTFNQQSIELYPSNVALSISYLLATFMAPTLTFGDPFKLGAQAMANYQRVIVQAQIADYNQEQPEEDPESEFIRMRE